MAQDVFPALRYRDAAAAIDWLERAFGFERDMVVADPEGTIAHAQLTTARAWSCSVRRPTTRPGPSRPAARAPTSLSTTPTPTTRALSRPAPRSSWSSDQDYGSREYAARDPEGNLWSFGTYRPGAHGPAPGVTRIVPYADGPDIPASRDFYIEVLGLEVSMEDPVLDLGSPTNPSAQIVIPPPGMDDPQPRFGVDVGDPGAVEAAHAEILRRGLPVVYPLTDEPWGIRRFFVQDPGGTVISILAHLDHDAR